MSRADAGDDVEIPDDPLDARPQEVLRFQDEVHDASTSWTRADPDVALIERWGRYGFLVMLPGGDAHFCCLGRRPLDDDDHEHIGWCRCKGFKFHDGPCAHLCVVRKADWSNRHMDVEHVDARHGDPVKIKPAFESDVAHTAEKEHTAAQATGDVMDATDATDQARANSAGEHGRLAGLSDRQREVFLAVEIRELDPNEAADELGISPSTARTHLQRARDAQGPA